MVFYKTNYLYSSIRWFFSPEKKNPNDIFFKIERSSIMRKISEILSNNLEDRKYESKKSSKYTENICEDINNYILNLKENPCHLIIGYLFQKPLLKYFIDYRIYGFEYIELNCSYSNKFLFFQIVEFLINN